MPRSNTPKGPPGFEAMAEIARRCVPFTASDGRAFAQIPAEGSTGHKSMPVRSRAFREWFFAQHNGEHGVIPGQQAFSSLRYHLEAEGARDSGCRHIRVGRRIDSRGHGANPDKLLIDLANPEGQYLEISSAGWKVSTGKKVHFETSTPTASLPTPESTSEPGERLESLRAALNLKHSDADWARCFSWLLSTYHPDGPFPILILRGPTGSGKSFADRILRGLVDPCSSPLMLLPSRSRELLNLAVDNWLLSFDHISHLRQSASEMLCRLSTGIGFAHREEGRRDPVQLWLKRPIILTVTKDFKPAEDLAARAVIIDLPPIPPESRRSEPELLDEFMEIYPQILAAVCEQISAGMKKPLPLNELQVAAGADEAADSKLNKISLTNT